MKKGKKIKELEEWLNNSIDTEFDDNSDDVGDVNEVGDADDGAMIAAQLGRCDGCVCAIFATCACA